MKISFTTKEESNKNQQEEFLKLSKIERFYSFLRLCEQLKSFPVKYEVEKKNNFEIIIKSV